MNYLTAKYLKKSVYKDFKTNQKVYSEVINGLINVDSKILDFGCGRGRGRGRFKTIIQPTKKIFGVDIDTSVFKNDHIDEEKLIENNKIPYPDDTFDLVHSRMVLEHVENPLWTFKEISRVLRKRGHFVFFTPNKYHYASIIASNTPHWFHEFVVSNTSERSEDDVFKTFYRVNNKRRIEEISSKTRFKIRDLIFREPVPGYLQFSYLSFLVGVGIEKLLNGFKFFKYYRDGIIGVLEKE